MESVVKFLQDCRLGKKQVHRNLTVFPVLSPGIVELYYLTLEQATDMGCWWLLRLMHQVT
jgi:hypothetical protein